MAESKTPDYIHQLLKWISYNRFLAGAAALAISLGVVACAPTSAPSPITGELMTATELVGEYNREVVQLQTRADALVASQAAIAAELEAITAEAGALDEDYTAAIEDANQRAQSRIQALVGGLGALGTAVPELAPITERVAPIVPWAASLLGIGAVADNRRKNRIIKQAKDGGE